LFEATVDEEGGSFCARVYKPDEIYRAVRNVAPDLIVHSRTAHKAATEHARRFSFRRCVLKSAFLPFLLPSAYHCET
jgi:hypothetical protein